MVEEYETNEEHYGGVEPVNIENLEDIREEKQTIPATKSVKLRIDKVEFNEKLTDDKVSVYRWLKLNYRVVEGIDEEGKYKNKVVFARSSICYYADPIHYTKDFFKTRQHLVDLKYLLTATGLIGTPIDGHLPEVMEGEMVIGDIVQVKNSYTTKGGDEVNELVNDVSTKSLRAVPIDSEV